MTTIFIVGEPKREIFQSWKFTVLQLSFMLSNVIRKNHTFFFKFK